MRSQATEVAIVGGVIAGLTAACYLARAGVGVTVFEKASNVGGRAATQIYDDYRFNRGIHALYTGGAASQVLEELGILFSGNSPGEVFLLHQGRLYEAPYAPITLLRSKLFGIADRLEFMRVFAALPRVNARHLAARTRPHRRLARRNRRQA